MFLANSNYYYTNYIFYYLKNIMNSNTNINILIYILIFLFYYMYITNKNGSIYLLLPVLCINIIVFFFK
jgi:hypothetical protein